MSFVWTSFVYSIIAFLVLMLLLKKYAFGPLFGMMEKRQSLIADQISTAEKNRAESDRLLAEQKQAIQAARKDAYDLIEQAKVTSIRTADDILAQAKDEATRLKNEAVKDIDNEKNKAIAALRGQVSAMSVMIASKIIDKQVDEKSQQELIDQYLKQVGGNV